MGEFKEYINLFQFLDHFIQSCPKRYKNFEPCNLLTISLESDKILSDFLITCPCPSLILVIHKFCLCLFFNKHVSLSHTALRNVSIFILESAMCFICLYVGFPTRHLNANRWQILHWIYDQNYYIKKLFHPHVEVTMNLNVDFDPILHSDCDQTLNKI